MRVDIDVGVVVCLEVGQGLVDKAFRRAVRKGLRYKVPDAMAYHSPVFFHVVQGKAAQAQGVIYGCTQVFNSVYESSVKVEDDQIIFHVLHNHSRGANLLNSSQVLFLCDSFSIFA